MNENIHSIISHYFPLIDVTISPVPFGLTNTTCFVDINNQRYVVRHYNRYTKSLPSLHLEMDVIAHLKQLNLSFAVPSFFPSSNHDRYVILQDGTIGVLLSFIPGDAPTLKHASEYQQLGQIVGEISNALDKVDMNTSAQYAGIPFTQLYQLHPLANKETINHFFENPPFLITKDQFDYYQKVLHSVESNLDMLRLLPQQLVHHDLLIFNLLSIDNVITGVLDFDFLAMDISFLEFAITLNHVLQISGGSLEMTEAYIKGYSLFRSCSWEELKQLQTLTRLYHVAILHIYIGQYQAGRDISDSFLYIMNQLIERDKWLEDNNEKLYDIMSRTIQIT